MQHCPAIMWTSTNCDKPPRIRQSAAIGNLWEHLQEDTQLLLQDRECVSDPEGQCRKGKLGSSRKRKYVRIATQKNQCQTIALCMEITQAMSPYQRKQVC